jgi:hypothetical protein
MGSGNRPEERIHMKPAGVIALLLGALLLAAGVLAITVFIDFEWGESITLWLADLAMILYVAAIAQILRVERSEWIDSPRTRRNRFLWSAGCFVYWLHWLLAFHFFHHWSHEAAVSHTRARSGFGYGILFSHLFTVVWTADVAFWWLAPDRYLRRSLWLGALVHGYLFFIVFQSTVVFGAGLVRWVAMTACALLLAIWIFSELQRRMRQQKRPADSEGTGRAT